MGECIGDPKKATVNFEGPEYVIFNIFISPEAKPIVEALGIFKKEQKYYSNCVKRGISP